MMPEQTELFNISDYTDREIYTHLDHGVSPRSTRRKQPKRRKAIALPVSVTIKNGDSYTRYQINPESPDETETTFLEILKSQPFKRSGNDKK